MAEFDEVLALGLPDAAKVLRAKRSGRRIILGKRKLRVSLANVLGAYFHHTPKVVMHIREKPDWG